MGTAVQARFEDVAPRAGLTTPMMNGGEKTKKYIWESTGSGIAAIDYDRDGYPDLYLINGSTLEGFPPGSEPINHLYHNNHDGTFTDVTQKAGLAHSGWGHGVCVGDYDNDGFDDLFVTYYGQPNILYHNNGDGTFTDVTKAAGLYNPNPNWGSGCSFFDYNRDGKLDLFVAGYVDIPDEKATPLPGPARTAFSKVWPSTAGRAACVPSARATSIATTVTEPSRMCRRRPGFAKPRVVTASAF